MNCAIGTGIPRGPGNALINYMVDSKIIYKLSFKLCKP
jgi:hypothetical protein